jgi:hypothetical protein
MDPILHFRNQADVEKAVADIILGVSKALDAARLAGVECEVEGTIVLDGLMVTEYDQGTFTQEVIDDGQTTTATQVTAPYDVTQTSTRNPTETTREQKNETPIVETSVTSTAKSERKSVRSPSTNTETVTHPETREIVKNSGGEDTETARVWKTTDGNTIS